MSEKTILGVQLRRRIIGTVTGMGRADGVRVFFKGTRAYTNGKDIVLPAIKDMAEIPYSVARALIGYAIHEVGHVRHTDFGAILRAIDAGKMEPDKLIKKFENCIEDYRIEREISREFPGAPADLTALRIKIHPKLSDLSPDWMADPRACGPLALTWTGSLLNGFPIPEVMPTLNAFSPPIRALVDRWTRQMDGVATTEAAVDLAIAFAKEAMDYADASRDQSLSSEPDNDGEEDAESDGDGESDGAENEPETDDNDAVSDEDEAEAGSDDTNAGPDSNLDEDAETAPEHDADQEGDTELDPSAAGSEEDASSDNSDQSGEAGDAGDSENAQPAADAPAGTDPEVDQSDPGEASPEGQPDDSNQPESSSKTDSDDSSRDDGADLGSSPDSSGGAQNQTKDTSDNGSPKNPSSSGGNSSSDQSASQNGGSQGTKDGDPSPSDTSGDGNQASATDAGDQSQNADGTGETGDANSGAADDNGGADNRTSGPDADQDSAKSPAPFADVLDENAAFDDFLDDLRDAIAEMPLPEAAPDATDGEVDPDEIIESIKDANAVAPNYTSPDPDQGDNPAEAGRGAAAHHYNDSRFVPVDQAGDEDSLLSTIMAEASGIIGTTARTIRRLLMAEEQKGIHRNRRDGSFDIRNISAIVRQTGTCYKKNWERPAPETHLTILGDFSGSMDCGNYDRSGNQIQGTTALGLSVTGMFAVNEATRNTSIDTSIYGFAGNSPDVVLYAFKEGRQSQVATRRKIGNYGNLDLGCTPTGEAMAAVAELLEDVPQKRRILLVMTDGQADDPALCQGVIAVLERRGVEVVAIGIKDDSVRKWCANSHVIQDLSELPQALLACIDPRGAKKALRKAA